MVASPIPSRPGIRGVRDLGRRLSRTEGNLDQTEPKKSIISNNPWALIVWHGWTVLSVALSITLIYLNLTQYSIGRDIGTSQGSTGNILGALQLAIKAHELSIVASLYLIARQWIQGCLMDVKNGTILALVGAERSLAAPSFLISAEFRTAVRKGVSGNMRVCALALYLFTACVISSLAGPASGALMIPRVDWFFDKELTYPNMPGTNYPHIIINGRLGWGEHAAVEHHLVFDLDVVHTTLSGLDYWEQFYIQQAALGVVRVQDTIHEFTDIAGRRYTNTSTTWGRPLDGDWKDCGTTVGTVMGVGIKHIQKALSHEKSQNPHDQRRAPFTESSTYVSDLANWAGRKYVTEAKAIEGFVQCRHKRKQPCTGAFRNSSDWCYISGMGGDVKGSQNLLLMGQEGTGASRRGVYMAEGPSLPNRYSKFTASIDFLIDSGDGRQHDPNFGHQRYAYDQPDAGNITICSISTVLRSTIVSSLRIPFSPQYAKYTNDLSQLTGGDEAPRAVIFHENWLDTVYLSDPAEYKPGIPIPVVNTEVFTYPPRNISEPSRNPTLARLAKIFLTPNTRSSDDIQRNLGQGQVEAAALEIVLGGSFLQFMSLMNPTSSQYSVAPGLMLPDSLMPEPQRFFPDTTTYVLKVYRLGYGFRLSSRTGLLGMIVLATHAVIAVLGSLWLIFWERKVIAAWGTVPDYLALGIGSSIDGQGLKNTCAGISGTETLGAVVVVGETTPKHLEISLVERVTQQRPQSVLVEDRYGDKYGCRDPTPRRKEKWE